MEIFNMLERLEDLVDNAWSVPLTGRTMVKKKEVTELLKEIRVALPDEIKQAKWIKEERQRFLFEAQQEAQTIIKDAENRIVSMIDESEITRKSYEQANETIINAQKTARDIREGSIDYADEVLSKMEDTLKEAYLEIHKNKEELKGKNTK
ncbi:MAG: ATPase [Clostridia bacterium]|nr:ATPase [Clostridia bacterium]